MGDKTFTQICKEILAIGARVDSVNESATATSLIISEAKTALERINGDVRTLFESFSSEKSDFDTQSAQLRIKADEVNSAKTAIDKMSQKVQELSTEIASSKEFVAQAKGEIDSVNSEIKPVLDKFSQSYEAITEASKNSQTLKSAVVELNALKAELTRLRDEINAVITQSSLINDTAQSELSTYSSVKIDEKIAQVQSASAELINDNVTQSDKTYSSTKIDTQIQSAKQSAISEAVQRSSMNVAKNSSELIFNKGIMLFERQKMPTGLSEQDESALGAISRTPYYRIPAMTITDESYIIVLTDYRSSPRDQVKIGVVGAISKDGGKSFSYHVVAKPMSDDNLSRVMDSTILYSKSQNKVFVLNGAWLSGGENWTRANGSTSSNFKASLSVATKAEGYTDWTQSELIIADKPAEVRGFLGGVGNGIELRDGTLVFPVQFTKSAGSVLAGYIYSKDGGSSFKWGKAEIAGVSENSWIQANDGRLIMLGRKDGSGVKVSYYLSKDGAIARDIEETGVEFKPFNELNARLSERQGTQGSFISFNTNLGREVALLTCPQNWLGSYHRDRITVYASGLDYANIVPVADVNFNGGAKVGGVPYGGYASLAYASTNDGEFLMCALEDELGIRLVNLDFLLPSLNHLFAPIDNGEYVDSGLLALYKTSDFTNSDSKGGYGLIHSSKPRFSPLKIKGEVSVDGKLLKAFTNGITNSSSTNDKLNRVARLELRLKDTQKVRSTAVSLCMPVRVERVGAGGGFPQWEWIFQVGTGRNDGFGDKKFGIGFERGEPNTAIKFNPIVPNKTNTVDTYGGVAKHYETFYLGAVMAENYSGENPASYLKIYINGNLVGSVDGASQLIGGLNAYCFGNELTLSKANSVLFGDIRLYQRELSADEMSQNYKAYCFENSTLGLKDSIDEIKANKLDRSELTSAKSEIENKFNEYANKSELASAKEELSSSISQKADQSELSTLKGVVETKANKSEISGLNSRFQERIRTFWVEESVRSDPQYAPGGSKQTIITTKKYYINNSLVYTDVSSKTITVPEYRRSNNNH